MIDPGIYLAKGMDNAGVDVKAFAVGEQLLNLDIDHPIWTQGDGGSFEALVAATSWLYTCYRIRADRLMSLPRSFSALGTGDPIEEGELPFKAKFPNLLWQTEYSLLVHGFAYWSKTTDTRKAMRIDRLEKQNGHFVMSMAKAENLNVLANLRWFDPLSIEPLVNERDGLYAFKRQLKNDKRIYRIDPKTGLFDELAYFWVPGMREAQPGFGVSSVINDAAYVLRNIDRFSANFFEQGAMPITLLMVPARTSNDQRRELESRFNRFASRVQNAFKPIAIKSEIKVERLGMNPGEVGMPDLEESKRDAILAATGVPLSIVLGKSANFATARRDAQNFISYTIEPRCRLIQEVINEQILEPLGITMQFRPESLQEMKQDERDSAAAFKDLRVGGLTAEAALYFLGYDLDLPDGVTLTDTVEEPEDEDMDGDEDEEIEAAEEEESKRRRELGYEKDLTRWRKKALKAFKRGDSPAVAFISDYILPGQKEKIGKLLSLATTEEEVRAAFVPDPFPVVLQGYP